MIRAMSLLNTESVDWKTGGNSIWVDVESPSPQEVSELSQVFAFNPLALEDALTHGQWSRFEAYPEHVFLVFRTLDQPQACNDETERVSLFWYPATDTLVTLRLGEVDYLSRTWLEFEGLRYGSEERLIYTLLAQGADTFFKFADAMQDKTDELEEELFTQPNPRNMAQEVFEYKHTIMDVRRLVRGARESVAAFARHGQVVTSGYAVGVNGQGSAGKIDPQAQEVMLYFRDVVGTLDRAHDTLESARDVLSSVLDANLSLQSHKMNEVMKTLTTVSAVFLPLTFLAGVWGMNFEHQPEFAWRYGYLFAWASFIAVGVSLAVYFKKRGWW
ncbi:magnesium transporter CorA family protein [Deinococcus peraridilitoris]|uniref:Mg2+/Co2+ transporter n=1 Tax=Deinococcus peraridilitoris (strain DSM 19664 / LMG 22246 / CIP 109416 / KR-200) TaxID=937777 RepID=L0A1I1_DEIPD|nr:magnesium transporter CorA family protein [Deinococcus peraridilitoris]AFZ67309.1 Mg2+/Co2+ transporter [Deinococcus peraridilitoris DSM 19664]